MVRRLAAVGLSSAALGLQGRSRVVLSALVLIVPPPAAAAPRPSFLILVSDDQRADTLAAWGNSRIRTPQLDRLVEAGVSLRANYCLGSNAGAVCVPSRAMMLSGRHWLRSPNDLTGTRTLPEHLRAQGYSTFATGKWHNQEPAFLRSFESARAVFFGGMADHARLPVCDLGSEGKLGPTREGGKFSSVLIADAAIGFLGSTAADPRPFFAWVAFTAPHDPRQPPPEAADEYYRARLPLPRNFLPEHPFDLGRPLDERDEVLLPWPRPEELLRDQIAEYYGMITHLDAQIGRILEALRRCGREGETVVVFAGDSGLALGSHGLLGKQNVYEHSMRSPLIFAGPGLPRGATRTGLTALLDLSPTICAMAGVAPMEGLDGRDLGPLLRGEVAAVREAVFLPFEGTMRGLRQGRWKLIVYPQIGHRQLFDLESDPDERLNLAGDPAQAAHLCALLDTLKRAQAELGDTQPLEVTEPRSPVVHRRGVQRRSDPWQPEWIRRKYFGESQ